MKTLIAIARFLFGLALLILIAWAIYLVLSSIISTLGNLKSDLSVAIIAAAGTIIVSVLSLVMSKYMESRAVITQEIRTKKIPIYEELISTIFRVLFAEKLGQEPMSEAELTKFFASFTEKLIVWGSDGVIKAFRATRMGAITGIAPTETLFVYKNLLLEIRKDLGHKNKNFKRGTLLGLFVNDIDQYL